jgi:Mg-chelatase subunit ChlD
VWGNAIEITNKESYEDERDSKGTKKGADGQLNKEVYETQEAKDGVIVGESVNRGINNFSPDMIFERIVDNYKVAKEIYGEKIIELLSGYDPNYVEKNIKIPEFQKVLKNNIKNEVLALKKRDILEDDFSVSEDALETSIVEMYLKEIDDILPKSYFGEKIKKQNHQGVEKIEDYQNLKKSYSNIMLSKTIKRTIRREHKEIISEDIVWGDRIEKGKTEMVFALDSSASMKGEKLKACKTAGIALCYWAVGNKDKVGLLSFGQEIHKKIPPSTDLKHIIREIASIKSNKQTDIGLPIKEAITIFERNNSHKSLVIITDAMQTATQKSESTVLESCFIARDNKILISVIGIELNKKARDFAKKICNITGGVLYEIDSYQDIPRILVSEYIREKNAF